MLEITGVTKRYRGGERAAVANLSIAVAPGEIVGLVGLNGAGKTTTIRIAVGVSIPSSGDVIVDGSSIVADKANASRNIGWIPETPIHDLNQRVGRLVNYYREMVGGVTQCDARASLNDWGLAAHERRPFRTLSLGERKRLAIVVSSLGNPRYYLMDEVFNGLDPAGVAQIRQWALSLRKTQHGMLVSSHQLRELQAIADRFEIIHEGRRIAGVRADQLPSSDQRRVQIVFNPVDEAGLRILQSFGEVERAANGVILVGNELDVAAVNRSLVQAGYSVRRLEPLDPDLEVYFLRLIEEHR